MNDPGAARQHATATEASVRALWETMNARDWIAVRALLHDDLVAELPVSGERFLGADTFVEINRRYPGDWVIEIVRIVAASDRAASEIRAHIDGSIETARSFYEFRDGKLAWIADWWPEPYPAPAWRRPFAAPSSADTHGDERSHG